ncbi:MAG: phytoene desaturase family protein [Phycisphaerales bacterium JB065]
MPQNTASTEKTVAIVGAGPGGLAAAMLLAASGAKVRIYEAQPVLGGRTSRITKTAPNGDEYHFDMGPTFFLMPYVLEEIFKATGADLHDYAELMPLDPMYRLIVGDRDSETPTVIDATQDIAEMARRIGEVSKADAEAFPRFIRDNRAKLAAAEPILRRPIRNIFELIRPDAMKAALHIKPHLTVHGLLTKYFNHPAVQLAVSFQSKYLGMSPYDCPSLFTILPFIEYEYGIWHPKGGCNALMDAMATRCRELGVEILTDAPVERLTFENESPRASGVVVRGERHTHDQIVINADAAWALQNLIPGTIRARAHSPYSDIDLQSRRYSCSTYMMYLGLDGEVDLPHHTIYISRKYQENLANISSVGELSEDPSVYVHNPSPIDPSLAPAGKSSLYVLMPTPNLQVSDRAGVARWTERQHQARTQCLEQLERRFGITNIESRIEVEHTLNPEDWRGMNIQFGATFNLAHNLGQMLHKRPQHKLEGFEGVWMVGGGTHPGSGLPVIFLSSQITASLLCDQLGLDYAGKNARLDVTEGARRSRELQSNAGFPAQRAAPPPNPSGNSGVTPEAQAVN